MQVITCCCQLVGTEACKACMQKKYANNTSAYTFNTQPVDDTKSRVIAEREALFEKHYKLTQFLRTEKFASLNEKAKDLLVKQAQIMQEYIDILTQRIECWE